METKLGKKIKFHENENIVYEKDKINFSANTKPKAAQYYNSMITITNFRIILSQKMLFGGYQIRYVIDMNNSGPDLSIRGGYISCNSGKDTVREINNKKSYIQIETSGGGWVGVLEIFVGNTLGIMGAINTNF
jgi:hypothetical protein